MDDIVGIEIVAIVKFDAFAQIKFDGLGIDTFPRCGQGGNELPFIFVIGHEPLKDPAIELPGLAHCPMVGRNHRNLFIDG